MPKVLLQNRRNPYYPLSRRLNGPQSLSEHFGEEKNLFSLQRVEPWISQSIA